MQSGIPSDTARNLQKQLLGAIRKLGAFPKLPDNEKAVKVLFVPLEDGIGVLATPETQYIPKALAIFAPQKSAVTSIEVHEFKSTITCVRTAQTNN